MKKALVIIVLLSVALTANAQGEMKNGVWEDKKVVEVPDATSATLYMRALEALSDWAGSQSKSKIGIDVQDKDEGIVVYKGEYYLGNAKANLAPMAVWDTWANFTLKVRCKEGRAQVSVAVPSLTFRFSGQPAETTAPIDQLLPEYKYKTKYTNKRASRELSPKVPTEFAMVLESMCKRLANGTGDDF